jgi:hypothetical protein
VGIQKDRMGNVRKKNLEEKKEMAFKWKRKEKKKRV